MQIFHLFIQLFVIHSYHFCCSVRAAAWLTILDDKQPTVFDSDIDKRVRV